MSNPTDHFRILNVRNGSVRVNTGMVTFDVTVDPITYHVTIPKTVFVNNPDNMRRLIGAVLAEYNKSIGKINEQEPISKA